VSHLIEDVAALVRATGASRAHVAGHDWGGVIAWLFAAEHPALVDRLVILNAPHVDLYRRRLRDPRQAIRSWYALFFLVPGLAEWALSVNHYFGLRQVFTRGAARPGAFTPERVDAYVAAMSTPGALTAALEYYRANARSWPTRAARIVAAETLVIWGEQDPALSTILLDDLSSVAPRARVHRLPDVGHWVQNEAPEETNRLMTQFLRA
jgi:pimeloyl-ACP methyl ester carboxylesterase